MRRQRGAGFVSAIGAVAALAAALAWSTPAGAAGDTVLSTASRPSASEGKGGGKAPAQRQREAVRGMPAVPATPPPQPYPSGAQMPVYVGPDGVVAVPSIDMTPNSGVVYAPPPPRSSIIEDRKR
ncbi:hypothetical protein EM868_19170 [Cupriavidus gilardii]|uniref:hypothetical protein n=1 Tax=Cupriavidus gilardii TaxID=82541 RepID=UPI001EE4F4B4|nr:hypothetical protein [Cupriavidus gilardii]MCG5259643.1 hypothetical protein [Cupriavidus gilardii]MDF9431899.1 hypothetical protein [Cupriavidus gilardii]